MKKAILALFAVSVLLVSAAFILADKPTKFNSEGVEVGWQSNNLGCTTIQDGTLKASDGSTITTGYDQWGYNYQAHMFNGMYCDAYRDAAWCQPYKEDNLMMKWNDAWLSNVDCSGDGKLDRHFGYDSYIGSGAWLTNHQSGEYIETTGGLDGSYTIDFTCASGCTGDYIHTMTIEGTNQDGTFSGTGEYSANTAYKWNVTGNLEGSVVNLDIVYTGLNPGYTVDLSGNVNEDGTMSGTATSSAGQTFTWITTSGSATTLTSTTCPWNYFVKIVAVPADATLTNGVWYAADGTEIGPVIWGEFAIIQDVTNDACAGMQGIQFNGDAPTGFGFYN